MKRTLVILIILIIISLNNIEVRAQALFPIFNSESKWGYINEVGQTIIEPVFDSVRMFNENKAAVMIADKWGYIDTLGNVIIKPVYITAYSFNDNLAIVSLDSLYGYINKSGNWVLEPQYLDGSCFSEGRAMIRISKDYKQIIDSNGTVIINNIEPQFLDYGRENDIDMYHYNSGFIFLDTYGRGYYDINGKELSKLYRKKYQIASTFGFSDHLIMIYENNNTGYCNPNGKVIIKPQYKYGTNFIDGYAWIIDSNETLELHYIDKNNLSAFSRHITIKGYKSIQPYNIGSGVCLIWTINGNEINIVLLDINNNKLELDYRTISSYSIGDKLPYFWKNRSSIFLIVENNQWKYINMKGQVIWESSHD